MDSGQPAAPSNSHPVRNLLFLGLAFLLGIGCCRWFRFSSAELNYAFAMGVLCIPFIALRPLWQFSRIARVFGYVLISPLLLLSVLMLVTMATCDFDLHPYGKERCLPELGRIEQNGYTVHLIQDLCGGPLTGVALKVEQRMLFLPGLYVIRTIDYIDGAYEGRITVAGASAIQLHIPKGPSWSSDTDRTYGLKRHVYF